jgi:hypothetical protein
MAGATRRVLEQDGCSRSLSQKARTAASAYDSARVVPAWNDLLASLPSLP